MKKDWIRKAAVRATAIVVPAVITAVAVVVVTELLHRFMPG